MLNKIILIGNVGQDPEIKTLPNGHRVANFSLATTEYWKDKNGDKQSATEWHRVVVYNENLVKLIENAVHKGSKLYLEGSVRSRKYTDVNNVEKISYEIILQNGSVFKLLESKNANAKNENTELDEDVDF